jgi:PAS domain S-box-containing protein
MPEEHPMVPSSDTSTVIIDPAAADGLSDEERNRKEMPVSTKIATAFGYIVAGIGCSGLLGLATGNNFLRSFYPGYQTMAFSTALILIFFGLILSISAMRSFRGWLKFLILLVLAFIAIAETFEFLLSILGSHFLFESLMVRYADTVFGRPTSPISPATSIMAVFIAIMYFLIVYDRGRTGKQPQYGDVLGLAGSAIGIIGFTFALSYLDSSPFMYGSPYIPIAAPTAIAIMFIGCGLIAFAGPAAVPAVYFVGETTRARLLRVFIPLTVVIIFAEIILEVSYLSSLIVLNAVLIALITVVFCLLTSYVVARVSSTIGLSVDLAKQKQGEAEEELRQNYEELTANQEELRQNYEELTASQQDLRASENRYRNLFENMMEGFAYCRMIFDEDMIPSDFIYLNVNQAFNRIIGPDVVIGKRVTEVFPGIREAMPRIFEIYGRVAQTGKPESFELDFKPSGKWLYLSVYSPEKGYFVATFEDITQHKYDADVLNLSREVLQLSYQHRALSPLLDEYVRLVKNYTGCDSVGIRLLDREGNIPYIAYAGFTKDFYEKESPISIVNDQCMCINVIKGTTDPQFPFYTTGGSFYMNGTTKFLATVSDEEKGKTRNVCNKAGYESVALIPFREDDRVLGLIHLADHRDNIVPIRTVEVLEKVATSIGQAVKRMQVEENLMQSEIRFRSLIQNSSDIIRILDASGRIVYDSPSSERLLGYPKGFLIGKNPFELVHPDDRAQVKSDFEEVKSKKNPGVPTEFRVRKADGNYIYVDSIAINLIGVPGVNGIVTTTRPIHERKMAELAFRESEEQYRTLFENANDSIFLYEMLPDGGPGKYIMVNMIASKQLGYSVDELLHMTASDIISPKNPVNIPETTENLRRDGHATFEAIHKRKDGSEFPVEISTHLFELKGRKVSLSFARDITDRKAAENLLRENEVRLAKAMDLAKLVNWELDISTSMFTFDNRFYALYGTTADREGSTRMSAEAYAREFVHPEDAGVVAEAIDRTMTTTDPQFSGQVEHRIIRRDGEIRYVAVHYEVVFDPLGNHTKNRGVNQDITERKRYELALSESEEKFRTLIENVIDVFYRADRDGTVVYASPSAAVLTGYPSVDEIIGRQIASFWETPADRDKMIAEIGQNGQVKDYEATIVQRNGTKIPVSVSGHFYRNEAGEVSGVEGVIRDISERKKYETALKESEEKFRTIFDTDLDALIIFEITANGMPGKIIDTNKTACTQLGYTKEELLEKTFFEINSDEYWETALDKIAGLYTRGYGSYESVRIRKDGERFPVEIHIHRMKVQGRDVIVSSARDVSDRKRQEKSLKISNQKLHLMNIVAWHDIQNKITGLRGYVELTKDVVTDEKARAFVKTEEDVLKVIDQQIQYTKEYQQMGVAPPQWIRVPEVMRRVFANPDAGVLDVAIDVGDLEIFCDPTVEKAFSYLVSYTLEPSRHADTVRVYLQKTSQSVILCYDDNGEGIPVERKNDIFLREVAKSSGFGMFFIHDILDISDMMIQETGDPEKGVRFEITIPKGMYRFGNSNKNEGS